MFEVVFLGTGAAVPTRFRNLSSTAVVWNGELLLFDCGEATQMQMRKARLRPGRLSRIFISHFHGDHIFGLPGLLTSLHMAECTQDVHLYGPAGLASFIDFHRAFAKFTLKYPLHIHEVPDEQEQQEWHVDGYRIVARALQHRVRCLGFAVIEAERPGKFDSRQAAALGIPPGPDRSRLQQGEPVRNSQGELVEPHRVMGPARRGHHFAYCVDTAPSEAAVELARQADLLVHEGTFAAGEEASAVEAGHSTTAQAAEIGKQAGVRRLVITHISGRYMPHQEADLLEPARAIFPDTVIARDLMRIKIDYED